MTTTTTQPTPRTNRIPIDPQKANNLMLAVQDSTVAVGDATMPTDNEPPDDESAGNE